MGRANHDDRHTVDIEARAYTDTLVCHVQCWNLDCRRICCGRVRHSQHYQVLKAVQIDAQEKIFALKLEACDSFDETTTTISTNPLVAASNDESRWKIVHSANRLDMLFTDPVQSAGLKFINQMDLVYAARHGGPQHVPLGIRLGSLIQATIELERACQDEIRKNAHSSE